MLRDPSSPQEPTLGAFHAPIVAFMVVAQNVEQTVKRKPANFRVDGISSGPSLAPCHTRGDDHVSEKGPLTSGPSRGWIGRKRQHVGRSVDTAELLVQCSHLGVAHKRHRQIAACRSRSDANKPPNESA